MLMMKEFLMENTDLNMNISIEQLKNLIIKYDICNGSYPESEYEGLEVYNFICEELGIKSLLEDCFYPRDRYENLLDEARKILNDDSNRIP